MGGKDGRDIQKLIMTNNVHKSLVLSYLYSDPSIGFEPMNADYESDARLKKAGPLK